MLYKVTFTLDPRDGSESSDKYEQFEAKDDAAAEQKGNLIARGYAVRARATTSATTAQVRDISVSRVSL